MQAIKISATISLVGALWFTTHASAAIPEHVQLLKDTNKCPHCDLKNANLSNRNLENADLREADLEKADLKGSNLRNADLTGAKGLTPKQIKAATNWKDAIYDEDFRKQLGLPFYKK